MRFAASELIPGGQGGALHSFHGLSHWENEVYCIYLASMLCKMCTFAFYSKNMASIRPRRFDNMSSDERIHIIGEVSLLYSAGTLVRRSE